MKAILKKELQSFFTSITGYFTIAIFIICNGLILWFFKTSWNILDTGLADLSHFFKLIPWIFILLISALTMRSFSEELQWGTLEILKTKQVSTNELILGKFFANFITICAILSLTLTFVYSIHILSLDTGTSIDFGSIFTSYIGLILMASGYISIGLWCSTFSKNQMIVLLFSVGISFLFFYGIHAVSDSFPNYNYTLQKWGMYWHYQGLQRGVLDTKDVLYFIQITLLFLFLTQMKMNQKYTAKKIIYMLIFLYGTHFLGQHIYKRFDCTKDNRYTLSATSLDLLKSITKPTVIKVYLEGNFPSEFRRLQLETQYLLQEIENKNQHIKFAFVNPNKDLQKHLKQGRTPSQLITRENGIISKSIIVPWASIHSENKSDNVSLLKNTNLSQSKEEQLEQSVENLEYAIINGLKKVHHKKSKKIAVVVGNGQLRDMYLFDLLKSLRTHYYLAKFTLDSITTKPVQTLQHLQEFNLALFAKPTEPFSEEEKFVLDQFTMNGGHSLWLIDPVQTAKDSLFSTGKMLAYRKDLNLNDMFFSYGIRLQNNLIKDLYCSKITLSTGNVGNRPNFESLLWYYHPLIKPNDSHPITKNLGVVNLQFASSIELLKNNVLKTILLQTSPLSKKVGTPCFVNLSEVATPPTPQMYNDGKQNVAVLLEGNFVSAYKDRVKPFNFKHTKKNGASKMIIISDGDIASNQIHKGKPLSLGLNKWTQEFYYNKDFLQNAIDYLLDDMGLLKIRSKTVEIALLNKKKLLSERSFWQWFNLLMPMFILTFFVGFYQYFYRKKFSR